jgi:hypothetical protein
MTTNPLTCLAGPRLVSGTGRGPKGHGLGATPLLSGLGLIETRPAGPRLGARHGSWPLGPRPGWTEGAC